MVINGKQYFDKGEVDQLIIRRINELAGEVRPNVQAAKDARKIMDELMQGLGHEMERFNEVCSTHLVALRQTRFAAVTEVAAMTTALKDVRQFFLAHDYAEQISRLKDFVALCEKLNELKKSGFLDLVADTMLRLAVRN